MFFPARTDEHNPKREAGRRSRIAQAKQVCAGCVVQAECLEWSLVAWPPMQHCILGGLTDKERTAERRRRNLKQAG